MYSEIQELAEDIKDLTGADVSSLFKCGLIDVKTARKWIIKKRFEKMYNEKRTLISIRKELSAKYNISVSYIEKMKYWKSTNYTN